MEYVDSLGVALPLDTHGSAHNHTVGASAASYHASEETRPPLRWRRLTGSWFGIPRDTYERCAWAWRGAQHAPRRTTATGAVQPRRPPATRWSARAASRVARVAHAVRIKNIVNIRSSDEIYY